MAFGNAAPPSNEVPKSGALEAVGKILPALVVLGGFVSGIVTYLDKEVTEPVCSCGYRCCISRKATGGDWT